MRYIYTTMLLLLFTVAAFSQGKVKYIIKTNGDTSKCAKVAIDKNYIYLFYDYIQYPVKINRKDVMVVLHNDSILTQHPVTGELDIDKVVQAPGKSMADIYTSLRAKMAAMFNNANHVIQIDDPTNGIIIAKGHIANNFTQALEFTLRIDIREERYKYSISQLSWREPMCMNLGVWTCHSYGNIAYSLLFNEIDQYGDKNDTTLADNKYFCEAFKFFLSQIERTKIMDNSSEDDW